MNETQLEHRLTKIETKLDDLVELYEQIRSNEQKHMLILIIVVGALALGEGAARILPVLLKALGG